MRYFIDLVEGMLNEFFTSDPALTLYPRDEDGVEGYTFRANGKEYFIGFSDEDDGEYYLSFTGEDERGRQTARLLAHNKPFEVFSGVIKAIMTFIKTHDVNMVRFAVDDAERRRVRTYDRILDAMEKNGLPDDYVWDRDGNNNYYIFRDGYR